MPRMTTHTTAAGIHTQRNSVTRICAIRDENKPCVPIGETPIGRQGKKYRCRSKGEKNATPRPPLVMASRTPWDAVIANNHNAAVIIFPRSATRGAATILTAAANSSECVMPRCPQRSPYRIPKAKPMTSTSGSMEHRTATSHHRLRRRSVFKSANVAPTNAWVSRVAIQKD